MTAPGGFRAAFSRARIVAGLCLAALFAACGNSSTPPPLQAAHGSGCVNKAAHYHFALDISGSLTAAQRSQAYDGVARAVAVLPRSSHVHVYLFGTDVRPLPEHVIAGREDALRLRRQMDSVTVDSAIRAKTDIYAVAGSVASRIAAAGPATSHYVFPISDGIDDPPGGRRREDTARIEGAWDKLTDTLGDALKVVLVPIGEKREDAFRQITQSRDSITPSEIAQFGRRLADRLRREQIERMRAEAAQPLLASIPSGAQSVGPFGGTLRLAVESPAMCGTYRIGEPPDEQVLKPGGTVMLERRLASTRGLREALPWKGSDTVDIREVADLRLPGVRYVPADSALAAAEAFATPALQGQGSVIYAPLPWWPFILAGLLLIFGAGALVWVRLPPRGGRLEPTQYGERQHGITRPNLARARGRALELPENGTPRIRVKLMRASRWASPRNTVLEVEQVGADRVYTATSDGESPDYQVATLPQRERLLLPPGSVVFWAPEGVPSRIRGNEAQRYPGYEWDPGPQD